MPLYGTPRDRRLLSAINKEILQKIIGVEVAVYKLAPDETALNIYGESSAKRYFTPVRAHALVRATDSTTTVNDIGEIVKDKELSIAFLRDELFEKNLVIEISDIIVWDDGYFQVDNVKTSNYWWGRNPETSIGIETGDVGDHGYIISVIAEVHRTNMGNLNIVETRSGINSIRTRGGLPRNL